MNVMFDAGPLAGTGVLWTANVIDAGSVSIHLRESSTVATVIAEASADNTNWVPVVGGTFVGGGLDIPLESPNMTAAGRYRFPVTTEYFRFRVSAYTSGTVRFAADFGNDPVKSIGETSEGLLKRNVAIIGDSRTFQCTSITAGSEYSKLAQGYIGWLQFLTRQRFNFKIADNYGVSGDSTDMVLARVPAMLKATKAYTIIVWVGTNDRNTTNNYDYSHTIANLMQIRDLCLAAKRRVVFIAEGPRGNASNTGNALTGTQLLNHLRVRQWLLTQRDVDNVYVADPWQYLADPVSTLGYDLLSTSKDGLHPNPLGAYYVALALQPLFEFLFSPVDLLPASNTDQYDAVNLPFGCLNTNPMMQGTAGTFNTAASGSLADTYSENATPTWTRVYSKVVSGNKTMQQVVIGGTGQNNSLSVRQIITSTKLAVGDMIYALAEVEIDPNVANMSDISLRLMENSITIGDGRRALSTEVFPTINTTLKGVMRTPVYQLGATTTVQLQMGFVPINAAALSATVRFGRMAVRKA
jgi:lysophospholipase L1-like esterase